MVVFSCKSSGVEPSGQTPNEMSLAVDGTAWRRLLGSVLHALKASQACALLMATLSSQ